MPRLKFRISSVVFVVVAVIGWAQPSAAQCGPFMGVMGGILRVDTVSGNPFQAVETVTVTPKTSFPHMGFLFGPERIARDSQGRVRREKFLGLYDIESMTEAEHRAARRMITICDPVKGLSIRLDTVTKTAEIRPMHVFPESSLPARDSARQPVKVCGVPMTPRFVPPSSNGDPSVHEPGFKVEELGHRVIEGLDTVGYRITRQRTELPSGGVWPLSVQEQWCSEDLGADMLHFMEGGVSSLMPPGAGPTLGTGASVTPTKREFKLTKLRRTEPAANLFEIPFDYRRIEPVPQAPVVVGSGRVSVGTVVIPAPKP